MPVVAEKFREGVPAGAALVGWGVEAQPVNRKTLTNAINGTIHLEAWLAIVLRAKVFILCVAVSTCQAKRVPPSPAPQPPHPLVHEGATPRPARQEIHRTVPKSDNRLAHFISLRLKDLT